MHTHNYSRQKISKKRKLRSVQWYTIYLELGRILFQTVQIINPAVWKVSRQAFLIITYDTSNIPINTGAAKLGHVLTSVIVKLPSEKQTIHEITTDVDLVYAKITIILKHDYDLSK